MESLELHVLSVILSFLTETEGTSFLITKRWYSKLLPVFRLKQQPFDLLFVDGQKPCKYRHKYIKVPIQNASVLLARLNTKRLFRRRCLPQVGYTLKEIAQQEWAEMKKNISSKPTIPTDTGWRPPSLELLRFLDDESDFKKIQSAVLVSYPRSGNTLLRTLFERITGHVTGSDTRPDRNLSRELAERHDLVGEGITHSSMVRFIKTHWPERTGNAKYTARRAVLVVRNPYDAIDSYWNMNATCSHTKTLTEDVYNEYRDKFERLVRNEIEIWLKFHDYWMHSSNVPILLVRYEDLVQHPAREMRRVLQFVLQCNHLDPFWKARIDHVTGKSSVDKLGSYRPRSGGTRSFGKAIHKDHITNDLVQYMHECAAQSCYATNYLVDFGYDRLVHDFPRNFDGASSPPTLPPHIVACSARTGSVRVNNANVDVRSKDCEFGRSLQKWRYSLTDNDANPLPTVS